MFTAAFKELATTPIAVMSTIFSGLSLAPAQKRPSHGVFGFLVAQGYHVIGVNPNLAGLSVHGAPFYKTLAEVPELIDMVDIFRNSEAAGNGQKNSEGRQIPRARGHTTTSGLPSAYIRA